MDTLLIPLGIPMWTGSCIWAYSSHVYSKLQNLYNPLFFPDPRCSFTSVLYSLSSFFHSAGLSTVLGPFSLSCGWQYLDPDILDLDLCLPGDWAPLCVSISPLWAGCPWLPLPFVSHVLYFCPLRACVVCPLPRSLWRMRDCFRLFLDSLCLGSCWVFSHIYSLSRTLLSWFSVLFILVSIEGFLLKWYLGFFIEILDGIIYCTFFKIWYHID